METSQKTSKENYYAENDDDDKKYSCASSSSTFTTSPRISMIRELLLQNGNLSPDDLIVKQQERKKKVVSHNTSEKEQQQQQQQDRDGGDMLERNNNTTDASGIQVTIQNAFFLEEIPPTIVKVLPHLQEWNILQCDLLTSLLPKSSLPTTIGTPTMMSRLQTLKLQKCYSLQSLPDHMEHLTPQLKCLHVEDCGLPSYTSLPEDIIGQLVSLETLVWAGMGHLREIPPAAIANLEKLRVLDLQRCCRLEFLPSELGNLRRLKRLNLDECRSLKSLIPPELQLLQQQQQQLHQQKSKQEQHQPHHHQQQHHQQQSKQEHHQPYHHHQQHHHHEQCYYDSFQNLTSLEYLSLINTPHLMGLPQGLWDLPNLQELYLDGYREYQGMVLESILHGLSSSSAAVCHGRQHHQHGGDRSTSIMTSSSSSLKMLSLSSNALTTDCVSRLLQTIHPTLEHLNVSYNNIWNVPSCRRHGKAPFSADTKEQQPLEYQLKVFNLRGNRVMNRPADPQEDYQDEETLLELLHQFPLLGEMWLHPSPPTPQQGNPTVHSSGTPSLRRSTKTTTIPRRLLSEKVQHVMDMNLCRVTWLHHHQSRNYHCGGGSRKPLPLALWPIVLEGVRQKVIMRHEQHGLDINNGANDDEALKNSEQEEQIGFADSDDANKSRYVNVLYALLTGPAIGTLLERSVHDISTIGIPVVTPLKRSCGDAFF